ncbi:MAG: YcxB family protein [Clostridiales bacterium]|nr:YcxB family protein [Clostridiales bacterium]
MIWEEKMNEKIRFNMDTVMEKEDYRKFLYIATFKRDRRSIFFMLIISFIGALLLSATGFGFSVKSILGAWALMLLLVTAVVCFKIEQRNKQRVKTDKTGVFGSVTHIDFYDDYLTMQTTLTEGQSRLEYNKFYQVVECNAYFIFYYNMNMATLLRKRDMQGIDSTRFREFIKDKFKENYKKV